MTSKPPTQNAIARALNISPAMVTKLKSRGMPVSSIEAAQAWRAANVRSYQPLDKAPPAAPAPQSAPAAEPESGDDPSYSQARARRETAEAGLAELALRSKRGELIAVVAVQEVWSTSLASMRSHLLQLSARVAPVLAAEMDAAKVQTVLDVEMNAALNLLAGVKTGT